MKRILNDEKGIALAFTVLLTVVLMITGTMLLNMSVSETRFSVRSEQLLQAEYIAKSGADIAAEQFFKSKIVPVGPNTLNLGSGRSAGSAVVSATSSGGVIRIESAGTVGESTRTVCLYLAQNQPADVFSGIWQTSDDPTYKLFNEKNIAVNGGATITFPPSFAEDYNDPKGGLVGTTQSALIPLPPVNPPSFPVTPTYSGIISESSRYTSINKNIDIVIEAEENEFIDVVIDSIPDHNKDVIISGSGVVNLFLGGSSAEVKGSINGSPGSTTTLFLYPLGNSFTFKTGSQLAACYIYGPDTILEFTGGSSVFKGAVVCKGFSDNQDTFTFEAVPNAISSPYLSSTGINFGYHKRNYSDH